MCIIEMRNKLVEKQRHVRIQNETKTNQQCQIWFETSGEDWDGFQLQSESHAAYTHLWHLGCDSFISRRKVRFHAFCESARHTWWFFTRDWVKQPILYLVNMSHLICGCVENTVWPSEYGLNIVSPYICSHVTWTCDGWVICDEYPLSPLANLWLLCQMSHGDGEHLSFLVCRIRQQQISDDRETQRE